MIDAVTVRDVQLLAESVGPHRVSLFLPTHRSGREQAQDPIRLRNLVTEAGAELVATGLRSPDAERLLAPISDLVADQPFWAHQEQGLALYVADGFLATYRLPVPVDELVVTADRFHLKPLIPMLARGRAFHVLSLSQRNVRLLRGDPSGIAEIDMGQVAHDLAHVVRWDDREPQLQSHGAGRVGRGQVTAGFHGQGAAKDTTDEELTRFCRAVDDGVNAAILNPSTPLVLAGLDRLRGHYRAISDYPAIVDDAIDHNPDELGPHDLHTRAWPLVEPLLDEDRIAAARALLDPGSATVHDPAATLEAAAAGRVDTLFVPIGAARWGRVDPDGGGVEEHETRQPGDRDLFDTAAVETLAHGGTVYCVDRTDVPGDGPAAALLRY